MAKYKGHDRAVFLDGYAQGWADGQGVAHAAQTFGADLAQVDSALAALALRYTDAPGVAYKPGGGVPAFHAAVIHAAVFYNPCKDCAPLREMGCDGKDCVHYIPGVRPYIPGVRPYIPGVRPYNLAKDLPAGIDKAKKGGV